VTLAISDIPGDDPATIAPLADVREIIARYQIDLPPAASAVLSADGETPKIPSAQYAI